MSQSLAEPAPSEDVVAPEVPSEQTGQNNQKAQAEVEGSEKQGADTQAATQTATQTTTQAATQDTTGKPEELQERYRRQLDQAIRKYKTLKASTTK
jgi:hypothetical protein